MTQQQAWTFTGTVAEIDVRNGGLLRIKMQDANGQSKWFSSFDKNTNAIAQKIVGSGRAVQVNYTEKPWENERGSGINNTISSMATVQEATTSSPVNPDPAPYQEPVSNPAPVPAPAPAPTPSKAGRDYVAGIGTVHGLPSDGWAVNMDARGRSIIRQVAFIHMENKDDKSLDQINNLVHEYEKIILGLYVEESLDDEEFLQTTI